MSSYHQWFDWVVFGVYVAAAMHWMTGSSGPVSSLIYAASCLILLVVGVHRRRQSQQLVTSLHEAGFLLCWECGYDLRGTSEPRCSECGAPFSRDELILKWKNWAIERSL